MDNGFVALVEYDGFDANSPPGKLPAKGESALIRLQDAITTGYFRPGERLSERPLAQLLRVSRTPVREALRWLQRMGLVVRDDLGRYRVTPVSEERARHIFAVREPLETLATRLAAERADEESLARLERLLEEAERLYEQGNVTGLIRKNQQFHFGVALASGNPYLAKTLKGLYAHVGLMMATSLAVPSRPRRTLQEHREILDALQRRDADAATELTLHHMESALQATLIRISNHTAVWERNSKGSERRGEPRERR